jgi:hypothetical protein
MKYQLYVSNIGLVKETNDREDAHIEYLSYVLGVDDDIGRASGETVTLMEDGEIVKEYYGTPPKYSDE